ncbi:MAG: thymidine phosphorylase [Clostridiales bacterium]|nr:thymidine phosphorylase [Clostridiales bacterium]
MALIDVIAAKKFGHELTKDQLTEFASAAANPKTPDYQLAALLMAIRINGMSAKETAALTLAMAETGDLLNPDVGGIPVDKHSTGGVGDTTTLILAPLVAACGGKVVKMSGRGLGHTGGTLDKLESIKGFQIELSEEDFLRIAREVGCCVVGQTGELAPADKRLYALRDVTSTVDSIPLIASSVMSKKLAGGARGIVLDVKLGTGALMKTKEDSLALARAMCDIGRRAGREMAALLTSMDEPLGSHVGNALEVKEAIDTLAGRVKGPLLEVSLALGAQMLLAGGRAQTEEEAIAMLEKALANGSGLNKFKEMITAQGGDARVCDDTSLLPQSSVKTEIISKQEGYITSMKTEQLGLAAQILGAGRLRTEDVIDYAAGYILRKRIGDFVNKGEVIAVLHHEKSAPYEQSAEMLRDALQLSSEPPQKQALIHAKIARDGKETSWH